MAGGITEKGVRATGIVGIFTAVAVMGYIDPPVSVHDIPSLLEMALTYTAGIAGVGLMGWTGGYVLGKLSNTFLNTQTMDEKLSKVAGYGAALLATLALTSDLAHAETPPPAMPEQGKTENAAEIVSPPPFSYDGEDTIYSLIDSNTVEESVIPDGAYTSIDVTQYDFSKGNIAYFKRHYNNNKIDMVNIANKSFSDLGDKDLQSVLRVQMMGCRAAMRKVGHANPHSGMSVEYLQNYCPHH